MSHKHALSRQYRSDCAFALSPVYVPKGSITAECLRFVLCILWDQEWVACQRGSLKWAVNIMTVSLSLKSCSEGNASLNIGVGREAR